MKLLLKINNVVRNWLGFGLTMPKALDIRPEITNITYSILYEPRKWIKTQNIISILPPVKKTILLLIWNVGL